jgi:hypothetical protein
MDAIIQCSMCNEKCEMKNDEALNHQEQKILANWTLK